MNHHGHASSSRLALAATLHCLTGCAIGEVLGMVLGTALGWSNGLTIAAAIALAFVFGYALTMRPLLAAGTPLGQALRLARRPPGITQGGPPASVGAARSAWATPGSAESSAAASSRA